MASIDLANPPPISGGSGTTPAVAGVAIAGETVAGEASLLRVGGLVRTEGAAPIALTRTVDPDPIPPPPDAIYGNATFGVDAYTQVVTGGAIYAKATYGQALYGVVSLQKVGGLTRTDTPAPIAMTRVIDPNL